MTASDPDASAQLSMRRGIPQRSTRWAIGLARALARADMRPNAVSVASAVVAAIGCAALVASGAAVQAEDDALRGLLLIAAVCVPLRLLLNMLDGMLAVEGGLGSPVGDLCNEVPDRVADLLLLAGAGCAAAAVPGGVSAGWIAAGLAVLTAYVRTLGAAQGLPRGGVLVLGLVVIGVGSLLTVGIRLRLIGRALVHRAGGADDAGGPIGGAAAWLLAGVVVVLILVLAITRALPEKRAGFGTELRRRTWAWWAMISVLALALALALLLFLVIVVQGSDVAQYVWGKTLGRHPVAPSVSPNKTWEGLIGGVVSATALGAALWWATPFAPWQAGTLSFVSCVLGFAGGLMMSSIKRDRGVKDFGTVIPGHGGIMDRFDSLVFAAPVFFHLVRFFA